MRSTDPRSIGGLTSFIGTNECKSMKRVRDAITFHYLTEAVKAARDAPLTVSVGSRTLDWCFEAADRIADAIMVRDAIGIETYPIDQPEVDQVAERLQTIAEDLMNFSGHFIPRYCTR